MGLNRITDGRIEIREQSCFRTSKSVSGPVVWSVSTECGPSTVPCAVVEIEVILWDFH